MTASLARITSTILAEVPGSALRTAAAFAAPTFPGLDSVLIRPGEVDEKVEILAAAPTKLIKIDAEGNCDRPVAVPAHLLLALARRHRDADQVIVTKETDGPLLSLRSFSSDTTVQVNGYEESDCRITFPDFKPGPHEIDPLRFNPHLVKQVLNALSDTDQVTMQPFSMGIIVSAVAERWTCRTFIAGIAGQA